MKRDDIVHEAKEWLGIKWVHQASLKGVACDCVGLVRGVYRQLTCNDFPVEVNYPATWHLFKSDPWLLTECRKHAGAEIKESQLLPGDIITFSFRESFVDHHIGIYLGDGTFIHSYLDAGFVVENRLDSVWKPRIRHCFRFPGVDS